VLKAHYCREGEGEHRFKAPIEGGERGGLHAFALRNR
jgi:hypothetical protein